MTSLDKSIRLKRFDVVENNELKFSLINSHGEKIELKLLDCSLVGLGAVTLDQDDSIFQLDEIISSSKLAWPNHEFSLGRLCVKSIREDQDNPKKRLIGFSVVDTKIPVEGGMNKYLKQSGGSGSSPFNFELDPDKFSLASFVENEQTNTDLFSRCKQFGIFYKDWQKSPKYNYFNIRKPSAGSLGVRVKLEDDHSNGRSDFIMMGSNDYLGLAYHPKVMEDTVKAIEKYGTGSTGSHTLTGTCEVHEELCYELARTFKKEKAILFNSGFAANLGTITALVRENDLVVADMLSHASLQDGIKLSAGRSRFYKHNDLAHLEKILIENRSQFFGGLVVTEGVFSMDGDVAPLKKIVQVAQKYNCRTLVDDAHGIGVLGENGLGTLEQDKVMKDVDIIMGNTSKTLGALGGFICADKEVIDWLSWFARSRIFSTSMPPHVAQTALTALKILKEDKTLLPKLRENIQHFVIGMRDLGAPLDPNHKSAIIPIIIGNEDKLGTINQFLKESGVFVPPVIYPAVSRKSCRFRFTISSLHSRSDIDFVINCFKKAMEEAEFHF